MEMFRFLRCARLLLFGDGVETFIRIVARSWDDDRRAVMKSCHYADGDSEGVEEGILDADDLVAFVQLVAFAYDQGVVDVIEVTQ